MIEYLNNRNEKKFDNILIKWKKKDIEIIFIKEGWISETYLVLKAYHGDSRININAIFVVYQEDGIVRKERIDKNEIIKLNYKEFIEAMSEKNLKLNEGSDNFEFKNIGGIEIRTSSEEELYPTEEGIKKILEILKWEVTI